MVSYNFASSWIARLLSLPSLPQVLAFWPFYPLSPIPNSAGRTFFLKCQYCFSSTGLLPMWWKHLTCFVFQGMFLQITRPSASMRLDIQSSVLNHRILLLSVESEMIWADLGSASLQLASATNIPHPACFTRRLLVSHIRTSAKLFLRSAAMLGMMLPSLKFYRTSIHVLYTYTRIFRLRYFTNKGKSSGIWKWSHCLSKRNCRKIMLLTFTILFVSESFYLKKI